LKMKALLIIAAFVGYCSCVSWNFNSPANCEAYFASRTAKFSINKLCDFTEHSDGHKAIFLIACTACFNKKKLGQNTRCDANCWSKYKRHGKPPKKSIALWFQHTIVPGED